MIQRRCAPGLLAPVFALAVLFAGVADAQRDDKKPSVSLKASPTIGFSPLKVRLTVEVRGGADDDADFYCPAIEWDFDDDLTSESYEDCEPHEPGKSSIRRYYSTEHVFREYGTGSTYTVRFRMKQGDRVVANASTNVTVRAGLRDDLD